MVMNRPSPTTYKYLWEKVGELSELYPDFTQSKISFALNFHGICGPLPQYTISRYLKKYKQYKKISELADYYRRVGEGEVKKDKKVVERLGFVWENGVLCTAPTQLNKPFKEKKDTRHKTTNE